MPPSSDVVAGSFQDFPWPTPRLSRWALERELRRAVDEEAAKSLDPRHKVGCLIFGPSGRTARGHNHLPSPFTFKEDAYHDRSFKRRNIIHAERAALADWGSGRERGFLVVVNRIPPCYDCSKALVDAGAASIFVFLDCDRASALLYLEPDGAQLEYHDEHLDLFVKRSLPLLDSAGVLVRLLPRG